MIHSQNYIYFNFFFHRSIGRKNPVGKGVFESYKTISKLQRCIARSALHSGIIVHDNWKMMTNLKLFFFSKRNRSLHWI